MVSLGTSGELAAEWIGAPKSMSAQTTDRPTAFADIPEPIAQNRRSRCGKPGPFKFTLFIKPEGRLGSAIVSRTYSVCEPCGSFIVFEVQKVFEK
jgi:hypothetical protein